MSLVGVMDGSFVLILVKHKFLSAFFASFSLFKVKTCFEQGEKSVIIIYFK